MGRGGILAKLTSFLVHAVRRSRFRRSGHEPERQGQRRWASDQRQDEAAGQPGQATRTGAGTGLRFAAEVERSFPSRWAWASGEAESLQDGATASRRPLAANWLVEFLRGGKERARGARTIGDEDGEPAWRDEKSADPELRGQPWQICPPAGHNGEPRTSQIASERRGEAPQDSDNQDAAPAQPLVSRVQEERRRRNSDVFCAGDFVSRRVDMEVV